MGGIFSNGTNEDLFVFKIPNINHLYFDIDEVWDFSNQILENKNIISELNLSSNFYTQKVLEHLLQIFQNCPNITVAKFRNLLTEWSQESATIIKMLCSSLESMRLLKEIDLSDNNLEPDSVDDLNFIQKASYLKVLRISNNNLGAYGARRLAAFI